MSNCATCKTSVQVAFVGKYCVRFGASIKQFCSNKCLEDHKKGLKVCCYCQKDISNGDGFLAPIGNKGQFKDFCVQICLKKYEARQAGKALEKEVKQCKVCSESKLIGKNKRIYATIQKKFPYLNFPPQILSFNHHNHSSLAREDGRNLKMV